jgi:hypothetical protein
MLAIATYVIISVLTLGTALTAYDTKKTVDRLTEEPQAMESASPQEENCAHDDGTYDEGTYI